MAALCSSALAAPQGLATPLNQRSSGSGLGRYQVNFAVVDERALDHRARDDSAPHQAAVTVAAGPGPGLVKPVLHAGTGCCLRGLRTTLRPSIRSVPVHFMRPASNSRCAVIAAELRRQFQSTSRSSSPVLPTKQDIETRGPPLEMLCFIRNLLKGTLLTPNDG